MIGSRKSLRHFVYSLQLPAFFWCGVFVLKFWRAKNEKKEKSAIFIIKGDSGLRADLPFDGDSMENHGSSFAQSPSKHEQNMWVFICVFIRIIELINSIILFPTKKSKEFVVVLHFKNHGNLRVTLPQMPNPPPRHNPLFRR